MKLCSLALLITPLHFFSALAKPVDVNPGIPDSISNSLNGKEVSLPRRYVNIGHTPPSPLLVRENECSSPLENVLDRLGTSSAILGYTTFSGLTAHYVCEHWRHGVNCVEVAGIVASGVFSIFAYSYTGATGVSSRDLNATTSALVDRLSAAWDEDGTLFESITDKTNHVLASYTGVQRREQRLPLEVVSVKGLQFDNDRHNFDVYDFGNGDGHVYFPMEASSEVADDGSILDARKDHAPGFKISFTSRQCSHLSASHKAHMAQAITNTWASLADGVQNIHDMIGLVKTGHTANFYYRIIPETVDFGLNYESVDICGPMGEML